MYFSLFMMHYAFTPVFLSTGVLTSHTYIYGHGGGLSGTARKAGFIERPENKFFRLQKAWRLV